MEWNEIKMSESIIVALIAGLCATIPSMYATHKQIQDYLTSYKINKEFILGYSSPEIEY